jgi:WD40 repeat protein
VAFLPDGKGVITAGQDSILRLWDRTTGREIRRFDKPAPGSKNDLGGDLAARREAQRRLMLLRGYGTGNMPVALSPDGKALAAASDGGIQLWEVTTGKALHQVRGPANGALLLVFSPDSKVLAARSFDQGISLWAADTGKEIRTLQNNQRQPRIVSFRGVPGGLPLAFAPDSKSLAVVLTEIDQQKRETFVKVLEADTGKEVRRFKITPAGGSAVAFSPDGKVLAYTNAARIHLCEAESGKELHQIQNLPGGVATLVFTPDSKTLAGRPLRSGMIHLWDVATGQEKRRLGEPMPGLRAGAVFPPGVGGASAPDLAFAPDGKVLAAGGQNVVRFWDTATGKELALADGHAVPVASVLASSDGKTVVSLGTDNTVRRWDRATGKELGRLQAPPGTTCVAFSSDGRTAAFGGRDATIHVYDLVTAQERHQLAGHTNGTVALTFAADGKALASRGSSDGMIRVYDVATGKDLKQITLAPGAAPPAPRGVVAVPGIPVNASRPGLAFSPDGRILAAFEPARRQAGGAIGLYDVVTGKAIRQIELPPQAAVVSFAFSPDGRSLAAATAAQTVIVWEVASARERSHLGTAGPGPQPVMRAAAFVSSRVASAPAPASETVAFSPDGRTVAWASAGQVRLGDVETEKEIDQLQGHQGVVRAVAFAADGRTLVSGSSDTTILLWDTARRHKEARAARLALPAQALEGLWADLAGDDAAKAFEVILALAADSKEVVPFLRERLRPAEPIAPQVLERLIADLQSKRYAVRQRATTELEKLGDLAVPALIQLLTDRPTLEARRRAERLLDKLTGGPLAGEQVRLVRALEVLERQGTAEARQVLETMARGAPGALPTREAQAAVDRLSRRAAAGH